ncbi:MAG: YdeI/OmpD-associated family protein [Bacteroidia bacterium]|nr:YdeI/OmpD-associated family protein [Bacteroidia bacterium]
MNPQVDQFYNNATQWQKEMIVLRNLVLDCGLAEELKWGVPCYTYKNSNILIIHSFKAYCALNFFKGALLKDTNKILIQQTKNVQETRQIRIAHLGEIEGLKAIMKAYIFEAIEVEKIGLKVKKKRTSDYEVPEELVTKFKENADFERAFNKLTEGRKRGYLLHFAQAKQSATRKARIEKNTDRIFNGKGLNDCVCGLSKRMPNCDGSHKQLEQ